MFAVTDLMAPGCDAIIPADIVAELQAGFCGSDITHHEPVLTIANNSVVDDKGDHTGTNELVDDKDDNGVDNIDNPLGNLIIHDDSDTQTLIAEQKSDTTLQPCWQLAKQQKGDMVIENGILYHNDEVCGHTVKQLCVPEGRRVSVMQLAHDTNHLAGKKTLQRIRSSFYWPDMKRQVYQYCGSCKPCQLHARARKTD